MYLRTILEKAGVHFRTVIIRMIKKIKQLLQPYQEIATCMTNGM